MKENVLLKFNTKQSGGIPFKEECGDKKYDLRMVYEL